MLFLPIIGGNLVVDVHDFPLGVVFISVCAVGVNGDECVTSGICSVVAITLDDEAISENREQYDDFTFKVFAVVTGTTGEDATFELSFIDVVAVDDGVIFGAVDVLEVRTCSDVSSGICVADVVTSSICTSIYNGTTS